ncbi:MULTISPECIES: hypothetical protein [unclassified Sphingopyxis]|uniref:hypothetical protein n=1 Tax=unclassified Sphingopyxis TaxID=2614943 RepID=UPI00285ED61C|nr:MULTISPECIES: hypothetical protein [unclassified Sphingopyxis]MDR7062006.1 hypothetical protein [Sphingopyxis sp. BE235]MDR7182464.1 hypothetical protein [Sphingopyxis sp. BE249]
MIVGIIAQQALASSGPGPTIYALNPADKSGQIALSNGDRTARKAIGGIGWRSARSVTSHTSGKYYWEWTPDEFSGSFIGAGFQTGAANLESYSGSQDVSLGLINEGSLFRNGGATASGIGGMSEGDTIAMAIDLDNSLVWFRRNGGNWNGSGTANPATATEGFALNAAMVTGTPAIFASASVQADPGDQLTVNFGQVPFGSAPPSGFTAWG